MQSEMSLKYSSYYNCSIFVVLRLIYSCKRQQLLGMPKHGFHRNRQQYSQYLRAIEYLEYLETALQISVQRKFLTWQ